MSRQKKAGLGYFPLDTGFFEDKRIRRLIARFGADGPLFYIYVLCKAYSNGYYVEHNDDFCEDAALDLGCSADKIGLMLHYLLDKSLLDGTLFNAVKVLSSHGIQSQFQAIKKSLKREVEVDGNSWILEESETEGFIKVRHQENKSGINADKSGINANKSGINDTKEKEKEKGKENKSKGKERKEDPAASPPPLARDSRNLIFLDDERYSALVADLGEHEVRRCINYLSEYCSMRNRPYKDWDAAIRKASREGWGLSSRNSWSKNGADFQPDADRIQKNNDWLDVFLMEQGEGGDGA